jgi:hypothetical protein
MTDETKSQGSRILRWLADSYEQSQRLRIETGERIRAVIQGRDETWGVRGNGADAETVMTAIAKGETDGPVPILGVTYRRHHELEDTYRKNMLETLHAHPAWEWLDQVKGMGPTLGCKLLARLDITKASTPSAYWAYCGYATVPAHEYRCDTCGLVSLYPVAFNVTGKHTELGTKKKCKSEQVRAREYSSETDLPRAAQPKPARGQLAPYDQYAKKIVYLVVMSFLKSGGPYERFYRQQRAKIERERPGWATGRIHYTAVRKTGKLFLSHLWEIMRKAEGLETPGPYAKQLGHDGLIGPWEMVGK